MNRPPLDSWQFLEQVAAPDPYTVSLPASTAWQTILTSETWTLTETSHLKVHVVGKSYINLTAAARYHFYWRLLLNGAAPTDHPYINDLKYINAATAPRTPVVDSYVWEDLAPGDYTITFEAKEDARTGDTRRIDYPIMIIELARA